MSTSDSHQSGDLQRPSEDPEDVVLSWLWETVGVDATDHVDRDDAKALLRRLGWDPEAGRGEG